MLTSGIKSKPVYAPLRADTGGRYHLLLGFGPGADALLRVLAEIRAADQPSETPQGFASLANSRVLLAGARAPTADLALAPFLPFRVDRLSLFDDAPSLLDTFRALLDESLMGTRLYVSGPESFIGLAMKIALEYDLNKDEIRAEEIGTLARRVYCVHCRATADAVRTNIVKCSGCTRWLLVRDHYSRRLAAYMGVMVDAEAPGDLPAIRELYS